MRIGVADLDTSHPQTFLPLLRQRGHDVVAVYGGTIVGDEYTQRYAAENGIDRVVAEPADLLNADVDVVFVHAVNWDAHIDRVRPFVESGIPVHLCKPFAGRASDLRTLVAWADNGARISGGSALRWSPAVEDWQRQRRRAIDALAVTYGHPLDYGIHAYTMIHGLFGPGIEAARALDPGSAAGSGPDDQGVAGDEPRRAELRWKDGRTAVVTVAEPGAGYGFFATIVSEHGVDHVDAKGREMYARFLDVTLAHLSGAQEQPLTISELLEPELAAVAGLASAQHGGDWIRLDGDPRVDDAAFDPALFAAQYRSQRRKLLGLEEDAGAAA